MTNNKVLPGKVFKKVECYSTNVGEMSAELRKVLIDPTTDEFKNIPFPVAIKAIQAAYDQLRETILECEGTQLQLPIPAGTPGVVLELLLSSLGLDLDAPIKIDSQTSSK